MTKRYILPLIPLLVASLAWAAGQTVTFQGLTSEVPSSWVPQDLSTSMRVLQYDIPGTSEEASAHFVVYYFGPGQGGTLEANLERWSSQFSNPDGSPVKPEVTQLKSAMPATVVELHGSYARAVGMGPGDDVLPDRMLLAAVVETPQGNLYPQLHGPADLVAAQHQAFIDFIQGIHAADSH